MDPKITLTAEDKSAAAWSSFLGRFDEAQGRVSGFQATLAGAMSLAPVAALTAGIGNIINELDRLGDQAPKVGLTAQALGELGFAAKIGATTSEALEGAIGKLSVKMSEAAGGSKEASRGFDALGIKVKDATGQLKGSDQLLAELADKFKDMKEGPAKTAMAIEIFGKSGKEMLPMLNMGAAGIGKLREEFRAVMGDVTAASEAAGQFNDNMDRLHLRSQAFWTHLANELLPTLNLLAEEYLTVKDSMSGTGDQMERTTLLGAGLKTLMETLVVLGADVAYVLKGVGTELGGIYAQLGALTVLDFSNVVSGAASLTRLLNPAAAVAAAVKGDWQKFTAISDAMKADGERARKELDDFQRRVLNATQNSAIAREAKRLEDLYNGGGSSGKTAAPVLADPSVAKAANKELQEQAKLLLELAGLTGSFTEDWDRLNRIYAAGKISTDQLTQAQAELLSKQPGIKKAREDEIKVNKHWLEVIQQMEEEVAAAATADSKAREQVALSITKQYAALTDSNEQLQLEMRLIGATDKERQIAIEHLRIEQDLRRKIAEIDANTSLDPAGREMERERLRDIANQLKSQATARAGLEEYRSIWSSIDQAAHDVFTNILEGNQDVWSKLKNTAKAVFFDWLYQQLARPFILNLGASFSGQGAVSGAMAAAGGGSGGGIGSLFGGAGSFGAGMNAGWSALTGEAGLFGGLDAGFTALGAGNLAGGLGTLAGVIGPIGLGATLLGSLFKSKGGPKTEGGYSTGGLSIAGLDIGGNMQGSQRGDVAGARALVGDMSGGYAQVAAALGLKNKSADFGIFYSKDDKGDSLTQLQVTSAHYDRSKRLGGIENVQRGDQALADAVAEEKSRAILAEIKANKDLAESLQGILGPLDAYTSGIDEINAGIARVTKAGAERQTLEERLFQATHTEAEILARDRQRERDALDDTNKALYDQVVAQEDLKAASKGAADAAREAAEAEDKRMQALYAQSQLYWDAMMQLITEQTQAALAAKAAYEQMLQSMLNLGRGVSDFLDELTRTKGGLASPEELLNNSRNQYLADLTKASSGDQDALQRITGSAQAYIEAQKGYTASGGATSAVIAQIMAELGNLPALKAYRDPTNADTILGITKPVGQWPATMPGGPGAGGGTVFSSPALETRLDTLSSKVDTLTQRLDAGFATNTGVLAGGFSQQIEQQRSIDANTKAMVDAFKQQSVAPAPFGAV